MPDNGFMKRPKHVARYGK